MARVKSLWLRNTSQKLGGAVTYVLKGQQIMREQAAKVSNPRTMAQMLQRIKLANMVQMWKQMRPWAKYGAFSDKKQTWSDYNAFVSKNMSVGSVYLTKEQNAAGCCVVAPYVIASGPLPRVETSFNAEEQSFLTNIYLGNFDLGGSTTLGEFSQAILANNNGVQDGDQISFICVYQRTTTNNPFVIVRSNEITLNVNSSDVLLTPALQELLVAPEVSEGNCALGCDAIENNMACAVILSRKVGGKILCGNAALALTPNAETFYNNFRTAGKRALAIASYGTETENFLDPNTSGNGSTAAQLNTQILAVDFDGRTVAAGGTIGSAPSQLSTIGVQLTNDVSPADVTSLVIKNGSGNAIATLTSTPTSEAGALVYTLAAQETTDILAAFTSIRQVVLNANGDSVSIDFANNGGTADPGDVTP